MVPPGDEARRLRRQVDATLTRYHCLGADPVPGDGAVLLVDRAAPDVWDANHVRSVRVATPEGIDRLLDAIEQTYAGQTHRRVVCDLDTPGAVEARLALDGWRPGHLLQHVLTGPLTGPLADGRPDPEGLEIRTAGDDEDWAAVLALTRADHLEEATDGRHEPWPEALTRAMVDHRRAKAPQVCQLVAALDGTTVGMFSAMGAPAGEAPPDGMGLVEHLFVHPDARGRGVALALIRAAVGRARARGAGPVVIGSELDDWPKRLYAVLGFRPLFVERWWDLDLDGPSAT